MSHPSDDELAELVLMDAEPRAADGIDAAEAHGRGGPGGSPGVASHVAACPRCSRVVGELRDARASVRGALATAGAVGSSDGARSQSRWTAPPPDVWDRIKAEISGDISGGISAHPVEASVDSRVDATLDSRVGAPDEGSAGEPAAVVPLGGHRRATARRRTVAWASGLAAASLAVGLVSGWAIWGGEPAERTTTIVTAALDTLDTKQAEGEAALVKIDGALDLEVAPAQALDPGNGYLEVWLINTDGKRMVSIGVLRPGQSGLFPVSQSLIDQGYVIVDISREQFDDQPAHSGDSLLRGELGI